ncbi:hypothetical protein [Negadavirga shengliensis]|uniref:Uncharacterized protein n=1 Tax=Negadavirga shengliensis TaxID=1389218 RepID=A0ABV9T824_9BACT
MAKKFQNIDQLFKEHLRDYEISPSPSTWERLDNRMSGNRKPGWLIWGRWAAAMLVVGTFSYLLWQYQPTPVPAETNEVAEISPTQAPPTLPDSENTATVENDSEKAPDGPMAPRLAESAGTGPVQKTTNRQKNDKPKHRQQEAPVLQEASSADPVPLAENLPQEWQEPLDLDIPPLELDDLIADSFGSSEVAYKVRIVSRGYAISPDKETLVDGIENKIGGFFNKVDQGFAEIQDAKNNLLVSLTTKKEKNRK